MTSVITFATEPALEKFLENLAHGRRHALKIVSTAAIGYLADAFPSYRII
jgi:hypothetical protein